jgi:hypothetical protein
MAPFFMSTMQLLFTNTLEWNDYTLVPYVHTISLDLAFGITTFVLSFERIE